MKILVVDDSKVARMVVERTIVGLHSGHDVFEAHDVPSAIDLLQTLSIDMAIIDLNMPGPDGLELVKYLLDKRMSARQIAVLTANVQSTVRDRVEAMGVMFIPKPLKADALQDFLLASEVS